MQLTTRAAGLLKIFTKGSRISIFCRQSIIDAVWTTIGLSVLNSNGWCGLAVICIRVPPCWLASNSLEAILMSGDSILLFRMKSFKISTAYMGVEVYWFDNSTRKNGIWNQILQGRTQYVAKTWCIILCISSRVYEPEYATPIGST